MELIKRTECAEATKAQYLGVAFEWGRADCMRMVLNHAKRMGHRLSILKLAGRYTSAQTAKSALERNGCTTIEAAMDKLGFAPIAPAEAWVGDIVALEGDSMWPALTVQLSNGRVLGFYNQVGAILQPIKYVGAWRVPCLLPTNAFAPPMRPAREYTGPEGPQ